MPSAATERPINQMRPSVKIRFIATIGIAVSTLLSAQTPQPTRSTQQQPPHQAEVTFTGGKLFVSANNSSLNQILHDIAHKTGMKITGGVADERVFGQYGPAAPSNILGILLGGTGSNMLLLQATNTTPAELILTPRRGGPTPPNPNASSALEEDPASLPARPQYPPEYVPEGGALENPATSQPAGAESPNAVKTPQQIFEQLQRIRQQQQQHQQQQNRQ